MNSDRHNEALKSEFRSGARFASPPSQQYSDCLYNFSVKHDRLYAALQNKGFTLNYVEENFGYLNVVGLNVLAFPMVCFCDIPVERHRILPHIGRYGRYGIGLSKEWGIRKGVQPVHYLIENSPFCGDLGEAFAAAESLPSDLPSSSECDVLASFLITTLAYAKPVYDRSNNGSFRSLEDECEWRFVPKDLKGFRPFIKDPSRELLCTFRQALWRPSTYLLEFDYSDITDLIVPPGSAVDELLRLIYRLQIDDVTRESLKMKVRTI